MGHEHGTAIAQGEAVRPVDGMPVRGVTFAIGVTLAGAGPTASTLRSRVPPSGG
jgi:hypothetical protein